MTEGYEMKVLVLGASGMLGHKLMQKLHDKFDVIGTLRSNVNPLPPKIGSGMKLIHGVSATNLDTVRHAIDTVKPNVVINCIGIIKQRKIAKDAIQSIEINALFPHLLTNICNEQNIRMIHFSTDCVFSGKKGPYLETDPSDAYDLYGKTKYLGEVDAPNSLTLRTSIIGREIHEKASLVDWFLSQRGGQVKGFKNALYTGFTTVAMADLIMDIINKHPDLFGVWHVSSDPINKYDLLMLINQVYKLGIEIAPDETFICDRRLDSSKFRKEAAFQPKSWQQMIKDMYADDNDYN
jgi:dTDP-4-dehydrorhamnose reductase